MPIYILYVLSQGECGWLVSRRIGYGETEEKVLEYDAIIGNDGRAAVGGAG